MFRGNSVVNMDAKGRVGVPVRYRETLAAVCDGQVVVTIGQGGCLNVVPTPEWDNFQAEIGKMSSLIPRAGRLQHMYVGNARDIEIDSNGRFLIPPELREHAQLGKKVVMVGQMSRLELWDQERWNLQLEKWIAEEAAEVDLPDELKSLSII